MGIRRWSWGCFPGRIWENICQKHVGCRLEQRGVDYMRPKTVGFRLEQHGVDGQDEWFSITFTDSSDLCISLAWTGLVGADCCAHL